MGVTAMGTRGATVGWIPDSVTPSRWGFVDSISAETLGDVGVTPVAKRTAFPAWRCVTCRVAEFAYGQGAVRP